MKNMTIEVLYSENALSMLSKHVIATHRNNLVGKYTNEINRRFYKAGTRNQLSQAIEMGLKDEMSQSNLIDAAKKAGKELDIEERNFEKRRAAYEAFKVCGTKIPGKDDYYPQEGCPMYEKRISDKKRYISEEEGHGTMAVLYKEMQKLPKELFFHRTWTCYNEDTFDWRYTSELTELGMETIREQDGSMLSAHGTLDVLNTMFSFVDFAGAWQHYADTLDYQGSRGDHIAAFRYVRYFVRQYKDSHKGTPEYELAYEALVSFLTEMVMNHFHCDKETAVASVANAAFKYVFTTDPSIYEDPNFARTSELLTLAFMSRWEENQIANGEAAMDADFAMPEVLDFEDIKDENADEDEEDNTL